MGDRVLFQVIHTGREAPSVVTHFGPVIYCHWSGYYALDIVQRLAKRMKDRQGDVDYATARLVQECIGDNSSGNPHWYGDDALGYGVWNTDKVLTAEDSHGDAGVVLIDCSKGFKVQCLGGYLVTPHEGAVCA